MLEGIIIAGAGGQGIMLLGKVLAQAAMLEDKFVTWLPCYGAEVRGGAAYCMVAISDTEIGSPYIDKPDTVMVMNELSWNKFQGRIHPKCLLVINSSLVKAQRVQRAGVVLAHPFSEIAIKLGNIKVANMVALGCYISYRKLVSASKILEAMEEIAPRHKRSLIGINQEALAAGLGLRK